MPSPSTDTVYCVTLRSTVGPGRDVSGVCGCSRIIIGKLALRIEQHVYINEASEKGIKITVNSVYAHICSFTVNLQEDVLGCE